MYHQKSSASAPPLPPAYGQPVSGVPSSYGQPLQISEESWSTGLCGCFEDVPNCCLTCCCPCITFGQTAEIVDKGSISCGASGALYTLLLMVGCACCYSCFYRSKMRKQYVLRESPCIDCLVHCCCESCALCQEHRELKNRGYIMSLGWQGNVERQNRGDAGITPPPMRGQGMTR